MNGTAPATMILKVNYCPGAFPVTGSVPIALLNNRMCGSGLLGMNVKIHNDEREAQSLVNGIVIPATALLYSQAT